MCCSVSTVCVDFCWVGWPTVKNLRRLACVRIWSRPKWAQVIASQRKYTPVHVSARNFTLGLTKRSRKKTQVENLRLLATPFGRGLSPLTAAQTHTFDYDEIAKSLNAHSLTWKKSWWKKPFLEWPNVGIRIANGDGSSKAIDLFARTFTRSEKSHLR